MEREYVDSSNLETVGYSVDESLLEVEFKSNRQVWQYYSVPEYVYHELISASSVGSYFYHNIRKGGYAASRIE